MKYYTALKKFAFGAFVATALAWGGAASAMVTTQLGFVFDGSGSINSTEFGTQINGLASAMSAIPTDGSVELTVVQFSHFTSIELVPTVITAANIVAVTATISAISQIGGGTEIPLGVNLITGLMTGSGNFNGGAVDSLINVSTDGFSNGNLVASALAAQGAGIDSLSAEAIGPGANTGQLLTMVFANGTVPNDGSAVLLGVDASPPNPLNTAWVVPVSNFAAFGGVVSSKITAIVNPVPAPRTVALMGIGLLALVFGLMLSGRRQSRDMNMLAVA